MRGSPTQWWVMHEETFQDWEECRNMMILRFEAPVDVRIKTFLGLEDPRKYLFAWIKQWCDRTAQEWVNLLIHALGPLPTAWYLDAVLHWRTRHWETLRDEFLGTFGLIGETEALGAAL